MKPPGARRGEGGVRGAPPRRPRRLLLAAGERPQLLYRIDICIFTTEMIYIQIYMYIYVCVCVYVCTSHGAERRHEAPRGAAV